MRRLLTFVVFILCVSGSFAQQEPQNLRVLPPATTSDTFIFGPQILVSPRDFTAYDSKANKLLTLTADEKEIHVHRTLPIDVKICFEDTLRFKAQAGSQYCASREEWIGIMRTMSRSFESKK